MYLPAHFAQSDPACLHQIMRDFPLATLITHSPRGVEADAIPLLLQAEAGAHGELWGHVARANPLWKTHPEGTDVLVLFHGPQAYVSPNWYPSKRQHHKAVPTWNYVMVQARGQLRVMDDAAWTRQLVSELSAMHEATQPVPWRVEEAPADYLEAMLRAIVGFRIEITELSGKWKVSQNQPAENRAGVVGALEAQGGAASAMAALITAQS
jgi:transcriptional regulator